MIKLTTLLFFIFFGAAIFATLALWTRQTLVVAYIILGGVLGPFGFAVIDDPKLIEQLGEVGIIFLLFLLGLHLEPDKLLKVLKTTLSATMVSSAGFLLLGYAIGYIAGFTNLEAIILGLAMMFSSTILGLKLLPTTVLHHQRIGEMVISILLLQDVLAIFVLLCLQSIEPGNFVTWSTLAKLFLGLPTLVAGAFLIEKYLLQKLIRRFDKIHEFIFLLALAWCLAWAEGANVLGLSLEIGAFVAGISLAQCPISRFIAENLKPLRDFFLILFFFSLGASVNVHQLPDYIGIALLLSVTMLILKPLIFYFLLNRSFPKKASAWEVGFRMGQMSEFSLLLAVVAFDTGWIREEVGVTLQLATVFTFIASSYWVTNRYPSPMAVNDKLRRY